MAEGSQTEIESTTFKTYAVSGLYALLGLSGLALLHWFKESHKEETWWLPAIQNAFEIVAGAGFIGILFEITMRRNLIRETVTQLKTLFDEDPAFATSLSVQARKQRVENTLKAHLNAELGKAIFQGLVSRYFADSAKDNYRKDSRFIVALTHCDNLKFNETLERGKTLEANRYCQLQADYSFRGKFHHAGVISVVCTLSDEISDLYEIFRRDDILAREVIVIDEKDRTVILDRLKAAPREDCPGLIEKLCKVEVTLNGSKLGLRSVTFHEPSLSFIYEFETVVAKKFRPDLDRWDTRIRSIFLKAAGRFPIVMACPTYNPYIEFSYGGTHIMRVASAPFLTSDMPFEPRIDVDRERGRISIDTTDSNGNPAWVFPSSGVIFTWQAGSTPRRIVAHAAPADVRSASIGPV